MYRILLVVNECMQLRCGKMATTSKKNLALVLCVNSVGEDNSSFISTGRGGGGGGGGECR